MANPEHLAILKQGVEVWNEWRKQNPVAFLDLTGADLRGLDLTKANLSLIDFRGALLEGTNLDETELLESDLSGTNLSGISLNRAVIILTNLENADLTNAHLVNSDLKLANLNGATLREADIAYAFLDSTKLARTNFSCAKLQETIFADVDLSQAVALDEVVHHGPSTIGIDSIFRSQGNIPKIFLQGAGVPDSFIQYAGSSIQSPTQYYSCFISHSTKNQEFVDRLYADFKNNNVRCWLATEDLKIGDRFRTRIEESIRTYDKLLLVFSETSVNSPWVESEVESALERERKRTVCSSSL